MAAKREQALGMPIDDGADEIEAAAPLRRNSPRPPREAPREPTRSEPQRQGGVVVIGRNGEQLARRRTSQGDKFHIEAHEIPRGWDYQWNTVTVVNEAQTSTQLTMHANGWRPVPAKRHAGKWTPHDHVGDIIVDGLRLEERPTELGDQAREEDKANARAQIRDQADALRMSKKLPEGMAIGNKYRGTGGDVRISVDQALDIPRPGHQISDE